MDTSPSQSRWRRAVAEISAIVASILIAFAIQAWWEGVRDAGTLRAHLQSIRDELQESQTRIDEYVAHVEEASLASRALLALSLDEFAGLSVDSLARLIDRSIAAGSVTLPTGAIEALIASGDLSLLQGTLSSRLAAWPSMVRRAEEGGAVLRSLREEQIVPFLSTYSAGLTVLKKSRWLDEYPSSRLELQSTEMFKDPRFEGHFALRALRLEVTHDDYDRLGVELESLVQKIDSLLGS